MSKSIVMAMFMDGVIPSHCIYIAVDIRLLIDLSDLRVI